MWHSTLNDVTEKNKMCAEIQDLSNSTIAVNRDYLWTFVSDGASYLIDVLERDEVFDHWIKGEHYYIDVLDNVCGACIDGIVIE